MQLEIYQLPQTIEVLGITFFVNNMTLFVLFMPVFLGLFVLFYLRCYQPPPIVHSGYWGEYKAFLKDNDAKAIARLLIYSIESTTETRNFNMASFSEKLSYQSGPQSARRVIGAILFYVNGGGGLAPMFLLYANQPNHVGRSSTLCHHLINDRRVSRLHATFIGSSDGHFLLEDQNSAGGTYVNSRRLDLAETLLLKNNDVISFNDITYRFQLNNTLVDTAIRC